MAKKIFLKHILTPGALHNAMAVHAAFGGSTNLLLHIPAIAYHAGLRRPTVDDWNAVNRQVPRLVDALPNGPVGHPTVRVFLAGGVPEVMLHLRRLGLLDLDALTVTGETLGKVLEWWEHSERRARLRQTLPQQGRRRSGHGDHEPGAGPARGLTSTVTFPRGNLAPRARSSKAPPSTPASSMPTASTASSARRASSPRERAAIAAIKTRQIQPGDILVLICRGPMGSGMEEIYQITSALKHLSFGKHVAVVTDARFSGVSTGACIGHVGPEALAGGPIGKLRDGDRIQIVVDRNRLEGSVDLVGEGETIFGAEEGARVLARRPRAGPRRRPAVARGYALVGRLAAYQRRHLGRLRVRRRCNRQRAETC